jgi:hypothetical protein
VQQVAVVAAEMRQEMFQFIQVFLVVLVAVHQIKMHLDLLVPVFLDKDLLVVHHLAVVAVT